MLQRLRGGSCGCQNISGVMKVLKLKQNTWKRVIEELKLCWFQTLLGFIMFVSGVFVVLWNEMKAVETDRALTGAFKDVQIINNIHSITSQNEGSLVYICGPLHVEEPLTEPEYGISVPAVILKRRVQMYQWVESSDDNGSDLSTKELSHSIPNFKYTTEWKDKLIDSSAFHITAGHPNPNGFPLVSGIYISEVVRIGAYLLSSDLKKMFKDFILVTSDERPEKRDIKMHAGLYYHTADVWNPEVGDIRVQFSYAGYSGDVVSVIAQQVGNELAGGSLLLLEQGRIPVDQMLTNQHYRNIWMIRLYRAFGWLCLYASTTFYRPLFVYLEIKWTRSYSFLMMNRRVSPYFFSASLVFISIISSIWSIYKPWISTSLMLAFLITLTANKLFSDSRSPQGEYQQL